ncbi:hypothetical protein HDK64DRAFT_262739 [Phyllosticta capitalensis]
MRMPTSRWRRGARASSQASVMPYQRCSSRLKTARSPTRASGGHWTTTSRATSQPATGASPRSSSRTHPRLPNSRALLNPSRPRLLASVVPLSPSPRLPRLLARSPRRTTTPQWPPWRLRSLSLPASSLLRLTTTDTRKTVSRITRDPTTSRPRPTTRVVNTIRPSRRPVTLNLRTTSRSTFSLPRPSLMLSRSTRKTASWSTRDASTSRPRPTTRVVATIRPSRRPVTLNLHTTPSNRASRSTSRLSRRMFTSTSPNSFVLLSSLLLSSPCSSLLIPRSSSPCSSLLRSPLPSSPCSSLPHSPLLSSPCNSLRCKSPPQSSKGFSSGSGSNSMSSEISSSSRPDRVNRARPTTPQGHRIPARILSSLRQNSSFGCARFDLASTHLHQFFFATLSGRRCVN